jgi:hypothetical protein
MKMKSPLVTIISIMVVYHSFTLGQARDILQSEVTLAQPHEKSWPEFKQAAHRISIRSLDLTRSYIAMTRRSDSDTVVFHFRKNKNNQDDIVLFPHIEEISVKDDSCAITISGWGFSITQTHKLEFTKDLNSESEILLKHGRNASQSNFRNEHTNASSVDQNVTIPAVSHQADSSQSHDSGAKTLELSIPIGSEEWWRMENTKSYSEIATEGNSQNTPPVGSPEWIRDNDR